MSLREKIISYLDSYGFVCPQILRPSLNGLLYTGYYYSLLGARKELKDAEDYLSWNYLVVLCEKEAGLLNRSPMSTDQEAVDDYIGVACASSFIAPSIAKRILEYGRTHFVKYGPLKLFYYYKNGRDEGANWNAWLGRFPALICQLEWAARETPPLWRRIYWAISTAFAGLFEPTSQDPWMQSYIMILAAPRGIARWFATVIWKFRIRRTWKDGIHGPFYAYFGEHPLTNHLVEL